MRKLFAIVAIAGLALLDGCAGNAPPATQDDCRGPEATDNRPNYCPDTGRYSTCTKADGVCTWTSCDGTTTSRSDSETQANCCCVRSVGCPRAEYWALCVG